MSDDLQKNQEEAEAVFLFFKLLKLSLCRGDLQSSFKGEQEQW